MWWMGHARVVVCVVCSGVWGQPFTLSALKWPDLQRRCRWGQLLSRSAYTRQVYKRLWRGGGIIGGHLGLGSKPRPRRRRGCRHRPVRVSGTRARGMCVRARGVRARSLCGVTCVIASFHGYGLFISQFPCAELRQRRGCRLRRYPPRRLHHHAVVLEIVHCMPVHSAPPQLCLSRYPLRLLKHI